MHEDVELVLSYDLFVFNVQVLSMQTIQTPQHPTKSQIKSIRSTFIYQHQLPCLVPIIPTVYSYPWARV